jgi:hypothetical protein
MREALTSLIGGHEVTRSFMTRRAPLCAAIAVAAVCACSSPAAALAGVSPGDATSTGTYLRLQLAETRASLANLPRGIAAVEALSMRLRDECPGVLANAPKPSGATRASVTALLIAAEESDAALGVAEHTESVRARRFARAVARLHWSNRALTRLVHAAAGEEAAKAVLAPPDLCADMSTWVSSGYQTVPAGTRSYLRREAALSRHEGAQESILRGLARYETRSDRRIAHQITDLEKAALPALLAKLIAALDQVSEVLHTAPAAPAS